MQDGKVWVIFTNDSTSTTHVEYLSVSSAYNLQSHAAEWVYEDTSATQKGQSYNGMIYPTTHFRGPQGNSETVVDYNVVGTPGNPAGYQQRDWPSAPGYQGNPPQAHIGTQPPDPATYPDLNQVFMGNGTDTDYGPTNPNVTSGGEGFDTCFAPDGNDWGTTYQVPASC